MFRLVRETAVGDGIQKPTNHVWVYDRSGSMYWTLERLVEEMIDHAAFLRAGDFLSVAWFSTEGEFNFPIKSMRVSPNVLDDLCNYLRQNNTTIGLTCFSEVLAETINVFTDMQMVNPGDSALMFFTDGHPVVRNRAQERKRVLNTLGQMEVDRALFIGYGDYYNKPFMAEMAAACNGMLVHASELADYDLAAMKFIKSSGSAYIEYYLGEFPRLAFVLNSGLVEPIKADGHKVKVPPTSASTNEG
jgi:hypothetical protein